MKNYLLLLTLLGFASCASKHAQINVARFDATVRHPTKKVDYFEDESQVRRPYTVIAIVSVPGEADVQTGTVAKVLGQALDEARKLGGEAIILHRTGPAATGGTADQTLYKVVVFGQQAAK